MGEDVLLQVVQKFVDEISDQLKDRNVKIQVSKAALKWLLDKGYDPAYGARPMRRVIQKYIEAPLSDEIIKGTFGGTTRVRVYMKDGAIAFKEEPALAEV